LKERLTVNNQKLLVLILNRKFVSYKTQTIYNSRKFYNVISFLRKNKFVNPVCVVCKREISDNHRNTCLDRKCMKRKMTNHREFELTLTGELLAHVLEDLK
jgi:hypothetical protein